MESIDKEIEGLKNYVNEKISDLPKLEDKLASQDKRISYLVQKLARMEKTEVEIGETPEEAPSLEIRLGNLRRTLADHGLEIAGFDECGIIRLKPTNEIGFDTLRKLNTMFTIEILECFFEQYLH